MKVPENPAEDELLSKPRGTDDIDLSHCGLKAFSRIFIPYGLSVHEDGLFDAQAFLGDVTDELKLYLDILP